MNEDNCKCCDQPGQLLRFQNLKTMTRKHFQLKPDLTKDYLHSHQDTTVYVAALQVSLLKYRYLDLRKKQTSVTC